MTSPSFRRDMRLFWDADMPDDDCMDDERELARRVRWEAEDRYFDFRYDGIDEEPSPAEAEA